MGYSTPEPMIFHPKAILIMNDVEINQKNYLSIIQSNRFTEDWTKDIMLFLKDFLNDSSQLELKTSGTTGIPKSNWIAKAKMVYSARLTGSYFVLKSGDLALLTLSSSYIAAKMMIVRALTLGLTLHIVKPSSNPLLETNLPKKIDFAPFVPLQIATMIDNELSLSRLKKIKKIIVGGGNLNYHLSEKIKQLPNKVYETFGMTETLSQVAVRRINDPQNNSLLFNALPGISFETDNRNCLVIDAPEILAEKLVTNDVIELSSPKSFEWKGRIDNMINSGGIKISPESIEKQLESFINSSFIVGAVPDNQLGEKVVLIIEDLPNNLHLCKLFEKMNEILPKYHVPKAIYAVLELKRNSNGKILRKEILDELDEKSSKYQEIRYLY